METGIIKQQRIWWSCSCGSKTREDEGNENDWGKTDHFVIVETRVDGVAVIVVGVYMPLQQWEKMRKAVEELNGGKSLDKVEDK